MFSFEQFLVGVDLHRHYVGVQFTEVSYRCSVYESVPWTLRQQRHFVSVSSNTKKKKKRRRRKKECCIKIRPDMTYGFDWALKTLS